MLFVKSRARVLLQAGAKFISTQPSWQRVSILPQLAPNIL